MTEDEEWKWIDGFPDYQVSNMGRVRSFKKKTPKILSPGSLPAGYLYVILYRDGKKHTKLIHQLVLEAFVSKRPLGRHGSHENGINTDNRADNLRWRTPTENHALKDIHGTSNKGERNGQRKLTDEDIPLIFSLSQEGRSSRQIAENFPVCSATIRSILRRELWTHIEI